MAEGPRRSARLHRPPRRRPSREERRPRELGGGGKRKERSWRWKDLGQSAGEESLETGGCRCGQSTLEACAIFEETKGCALAWSLANSARSNASPAPSGGEMLRGERTGGSARGLASPTGYYLSSLRDGKAGPRDSVTC